MEIDKKFVEYSDKIIIQTFLWLFNYRRYFKKVIEEAGAEKVQAVIISLYKNTKTQREYREKLEKF